MEEAVYGSEAELAGLAELAELRRVNCTSNGRTMKES